MDLILPWTHDAGTILVSATINHANAVYDPDTEKVITALVDRDDGDAGDAFVITTAGATSNLTSTNFLEFLMLLIQTVIPLPFKPLAHKMMLKVD